MVDNPQPETIEQKTSVVGDWIRLMSETGKVADIDPALVKDVLEAHGALFDISETERNSLGKYTNQGKYLGMKAVWGEKFSAYKDWLKTWIRSYEVDVLNGRELPKLGKVPEDGEPDNRTKDSDMIQFFGELTAFAAGALSKADFKKYAEVRMFNGLIWNQYPNSEDRKKFQLKIKVPTDDEPIRISSIPPQFPLAAWEFLTK